MSTYTKPYLALQEQLDLLKPRGMKITDERTAIKYLKRIRKSTKALPDNADPRL
jgi:abortive infection bacteriophage resistance protein